MFPQTPKRKDAFSTGEEDDGEEESEFGLPPRQLAMVKRKREADAKKSARVK